jgi:predicted DsbA family dithiol-disulfide isomerase
VRTDRLRDEFNLQLRWSVFPLHPETPQEGRELSELFVGRMDIDSMLQRLYQVAGELELPIGQRSCTYNSRRAQELGKWAEEQGVGEAFHMAVYHAYFVDGRNIALPEELVPIATGLGLDSEMARQVIDTRSHAAAVDADWQRAAELGITAVPTSIFQERALVGFQPYAYYRRLISTAD